MRAPAAVSPSPMRSKRICGDGAPPDCGKRARLAPVGHQDRGMDRGLPVDAQ